MEQKPALTHFNDEGRARMVDVSAKEKTLRIARAACRLPPALFNVKRPRSFLTACRVQNRFCYSYHLRVKVRNAPRRKKDPWKTTQ